LLRRFVAEEIGKADSVAASAMNDPLFRRILAELNRVLMKFAFDSEPNVRVRRTMALRHDISMTRERQSNDIRHHQSVM
jgi:hypothetical protein